MVWIYEVVWGEGYYIMVVGIVGENVVGVGFYIVLGFMEIGCML